MHFMHLLFAAVIPVPSLVPFPRCWFRSWLVLNPAAASTRPGACAPAHAPAPRRQHSLSATRTYRFKDSNSLLSRSAALPERLKIASSLSLSDLNPASTRPDLARVRLRVRGPLNLFSPALHPQTQPAVRSVPSRVSRPLLLHCATY